MKVAFVDCKGLACPNPVVKVNTLLQESRPADIEVIVDNQAACENVSRLLGTKGYTHTHREENGLWRIAAHTDETAEEVAAEDVPQYSNVFAPEDMRTLVLIVTPVFGKGDDTLGGKLMKNFLGALPEMGSALWRIVLLNGGVGLATEDSAVLGELQALEKSGVSILVCGTCLEYFGLMPKKAVGETTNMLDVVTSLQMAHKVIRI